MTFLNILLLGGMAAAAIPVLLHFFNRSRPRVVPWGAMHLLDAAFQAHTRRLKFEQLLLLLVRCLIPVLLALCMARPVLTGMRALLGGAKTSLVILLDNSYSMSAGALTLDIAGPKGAGTCTGMIDGVGYIGGAVAAWAAGVLADRMGWSQVFLFVAVCSLFTVFWTLHMSRSHHRRAALATAKAGA